MNGVELIREERRRQVEVEGWTSKHDDTHTDGEMAEAAVCYALTPAWREAKLNQPAVDTTLIEYLTDGLSLQGWSVKLSPNGDRIRELTKAGALIAAEIDRLLRVSGEGAEGGETDPEHSEPSREHLEGYY